MCGRYAASREIAELVETFGIERTDGATELPPDYNVAPTTSVYAVMERLRPETSDAERERHLRTVRWGLVPSWAKDLSGGARMINARSETLAAKPAFRAAYARRRCLVPADGYYEWYATAGGTASKPRKQPFYFTRTDGDVLAMAGLYEIWRDPSRAADDPLRYVWSASVITTSAPDEFGVIHDRMPMGVASTGWDAWLDPALVEPDAVSALMEPAAAFGLRAYPVSTLVNAVKNNGPELIEPLPIIDEPTVGDPIGGEKGQDGDDSPTLL